LRPRIDVGGRNTIKGPDKVLTTEIEFGTAPPHLSAARSLFLEYAESLGFSLCFQDLDREGATETMNDER
jgi:hypothetical protein